MFSLLFVSPKTCLVVLLLLRSLAAACPSSPPPHNRGKCFTPGGELLNFSDGDRPANSTVIRGNWSIGRSLSAGGGDAVLIRYDDADTVQATATYVATGRCIAAPLLLPPSFLPPSYSSCKRRSFRFFFC